MGLLDFGEDGFFGFVGNGEAGEIGERWQIASAAASEFVLGEFWKIGSEGGLNDGMIGLVGLDDDAGSIKVSTADAANDLSKELKTAFFGGEVGQGESGIGLYDANGGKMRQVESASESLGANEDVNLARFNGLIKFGEAAGFLIITVKSGNFGLRKKGGKFGFE